MILKIKNNAGSAIIEFIIAGIVFCLILAGAFQMMLLYEGHVRLQQAAFEAARHGIVNNGTAAAIKKGFIQNSLDLYIHGTKPEDILKAYKLSQKALCITHVFVREGTKGWNSDSNQVYNSHTRQRYI